jgi:hypothetical protein
MFKNQEWTTLGTRHKAKTNIKKAQQKRHATGLWFSPDSPVSTTNKLTTTI